MIEEVDCNPWSTDHWDMLVHTPQTNMGSHPVMFQIRKSGKEFSDSRPKFQFGVNLSSKKERKANLY